MKDVSIPIPIQIGPYRVVRPLAQGGMAAVFEVEDPHTRERQSAEELALRALIDAEGRGAGEGRPARAEAGRAGVAEDEQPVADEVERVGQHREQERRTRVARGL